ncbi:putative DNA-binding domain-containing protein [Dongia sp.]|uniref:HvfC/BufC family peptide modification chaperone n=1 Tax=Dongia sp. TaxID=1977262 RepID=UPI0035AF76C9
MLRLNDTMATFAASIWRQGAPAPADWLPAMRIAIHRNNVHGGLLSALAAHFPVVRRLLGEECFDGCAARFVVAAPPRSPVLMFYGEGFADFIGSLSELRSLRYLPDVARLEWARHVALNGLDAPVLVPADLAHVPPVRVADLVLELHPTARILRSDYPIQSIWQTNSHDAAVRPVPADLPGETVLILRPRESVLALTLAPGQAAFLHALAHGKSLLHSTAPDLDLASTLSTLLGAGAFTRFRLHEFQD